MQNVAEPAPISTAYCFRFSSRWRFEELEETAAMELLVAESRVIEGVWKGCFHASPHCGSPVVTRVLAHCPIDESIPALLSFCSFESLDAGVREVYGRFCAVRRVVEGGGFPPLEFTAHCPIVDVASSTSSVASRLLKAISARSSYKKRPTHIGTAYLSVM